MLINTFLDTEDFVHLYYAEDETAPAQNCGQGARMAAKCPQRPPSPDYSQAQVSTAQDEMSSRSRYRAPPQPEPPPHRVRAADLYPRLRTHCDEPGLDAGFTPICGEFLQWVGRLADGGTIAMSNYRLHLQPRRRNGPGSSVPLRLVDGLEIRDLVHLLVLCKHGRQLKATFSTGDQCMEWWRRLNTALAPIGSIQETFAAAYAAWAKEQPPASVHRALMRASHASHRHWFGPEVERLGFTTKGAWRVTAANAEYKLCPSYPPLLVVPASIGDEDLDSVARFRAMRRIPTVVWRHSGNGAVIARSSQPEVGWLGWRSSEDERLLAAFVTACNADRGLQPASTANKNLKLLIVDARSYASAVTNRARGGGCECQQYYPLADIQFMCLPNIHHVRRSFQQLRALAAEPSDQANWHSNLERTLWPQYVSGVIRAAGVVARAVLGGRPALVHCSDGWDRTPQIVAAAQLLLDPHYRTLEGFRVLIEREWLDFGHKFADRCGHQFGAEEPNERSPIFLQWLDVVHQLMAQYPCSFEFNEAYLIKLATHVHSCMFGTFLCNTSKERLDCRAHELTAQVWHLLRAPVYRNHLYSPHAAGTGTGMQVLWPEYSVRAMRLWSGMWGGERLEPLDEPAPPHQPPHAPKPAPGLMTKTRSCDNLLNEGEKRTTQRRCSDPSIAPDVMKLSLYEGAACTSRRNCRALTDSCVDELPLPAPSNDQVDGLHPDHFENSTLVRDIASGSSSLERELVASRPGAEPDAEPGAEPDADSPGEADVIRDAMAEVLVAETPRESGRTRNISITWRSISESSNQSSTGFDIPDTHNRGEPTPSSHESSPIDNHNSTDGDLVNHNVVNHNGVNGVNGVNGITNGVVDVTAKFLEVELNGGATSSSVSSESEGEAAGSTARRPGGRRHGSQQTLCPASPRRPPCCHSTTSGIETSGESAADELSQCWCSGSVRCVCGAGARAAPDPLDGLAVAPDPTQARLHQIILYQKVRVQSAAAPDPLDGLAVAPDPTQARLHQIILYQKVRVQSAAAPDPLDGLAVAPDPTQARLHQIILYQKVRVQSAAAPDPLDGLAVAPDPTQARLHQIILYQKVRVQSAAAPDPLDGLAVAPDPTQARLHQIILYQKVRVQSAAAPDPLDGLAVAPDPTQARLHQIILYQKVRVQSAAAPDPLDGLAVAPDPTQARLHQIILYQKVRVQSAAAPDPLDGLAVAPDPTQARLHQIILYQKVRVQSAAAPDPLDGLAVAPDPTQARLHQIILYQKVRVQSAAAPDPLDGLAVAPDPTQARLHQIILYQKVRVQSAAAPDPLDGLAVAPDPTQARLHQIILYQKVRVQSAAAPDPLDGLAVAPDPTQARLHQIILYQKVRVQSAAAPDPLDGLAVAPDPTQARLHQIILYQKVRVQSAAAPDPLDGLAVAPDPTQARLHQIILYQKKVVEELSGQLRQARELLRRQSASPNGAAPSAAPQAEPVQRGRSQSGASSASASGSGSGSASEVEVGEEARGVVWVPDSAAPRCQHCRNHFWLARRRHHCRRCGGIFCGSCSEMSSWGDCGPVRVCRRCRAAR